MILTFEDADGRSGRVTGDLAVEYDGQWERQVEACVESVAEEYRSNGNVADEEALSTLVVELPKQARVVEAERHHE